MTERLKNTILCTLMFSRSRLIALVIIETIITAVMIYWKEVFDKMPIFFPGDLLIGIFMFTYGITFFERHTPFCIANAVSEKYRAVSQTVVTGGIFFITAAYGCIFGRAVTDSYVFSLADALRIWVCGAFPRKGFLPLSITENTALYAFIFSAGYFFGAVKYAKSGGFALGVTAAAAALLWGIAAIGHFTWINPLAWLIGAIPAVMLKNGFTAFILYAAAALGITRLSYGLSFSVRTGKMEVK